MNLTQKDLPLKNKKFSYFSSIHFLQNIKKTHITILQQYLLPILKYSESSIEMKKEKPLNLFKSKQGIKPSRL